MTVILKQFQATPPPASVKAVEEICVTYGGVHPYYHCLATDGNTFPEFWDNIQGYVSAAAVNYNQGNSSYRPSGVANQIRPPGSMSNQTNELKNMMDSFFQMNTASTSGSRPLPSNTIANPKGELKAITTQKSLVFDGPSVPMPPPFINPEEDERVEETLTDPELGEFTIKKMLKALLSNKEKLLELANTPLNENCLAVILKKLPEKLGDPGKFLIPCGFSELKYKALADLVHGEVMILRDGDERLTLNMRHDTSSYSNQPQKESINKINIYNDSCEDYLEYLFATNHLSGNPTFSSHTDLTSSKVINPLSGGTASSSSSNHLLDEFADELALITFPPGNDDLPFDIESDHREIEYLLNHDPTKEMDSILEDSVDEDNLADPMKIFLIPFPRCSSMNMLLIIHLRRYIMITMMILSSDFLPSPEYDSFLFEDFFEVDALPSTNNKDTLFNLGIFIQEYLSEVTVQVTPDKNVKKISIFNASLILEDFDILHFLIMNFLSTKNFPGQKLYSRFHPKMRKKFSNLRFLLLKEFILLFSRSYHRGPKAFKVIKFFERPVEIFPFSYGEDIRILDVSYLNFYPP
nr:reverse transcriptase domain-containing protein [Tanacetum cinerariifolium]